MRIRLDTVIVAYGNGPTVADCVSAAKSIPGNGRVIVVDHGRDGTGALAEQAGAEVIADPSNPGFGAGQNHGVAASNAPYVLLLNPDAVPVPEAVARGLDYLESHPLVAAVQGVVVNTRTGSPERSQGVALGPVHLWGRAIGARRALALPGVAMVAGRLGSLRDHVERTPAEPVAVPWLAATALLVRREAFVQVGGFDVSYFLYGEDLDLARRLRDHGWALVALQDEWARHESGGSSSGWWSREVAWWEGTMRYAAMWWPTRAWWTGVAAAFVRWLWLAGVSPRQAGTAWERIVRAPLRRRGDLGRE